MVICMIAKRDLEILSLEELRKTKIENLKDISSFDIKKDASPTYRTLFFLEQIGNPYLFKVGTTPVRVSFTQGGPTLQRCLEKFFDDQ